MKLYDLHNEHLKLTLSDVGASWLSCQVKTADGWREVLVTTTPERWAEQTAYFGATVGRYANRIANGRYTLNGKEFVLAQNNGQNNLHGGTLGADKKQWTVEMQSSQAVRFHQKFANGEEGFGGEINATVEYRLTGNQITILFNAISDQDTPLCLTNHAYFNLSGEATIHHHRLQLNASHYLPVGADGIPNAPLKNVVGTHFDFRQPKTLGEDLLKDADQQAVKGYDHAFLLAKNQQNQTACTLSVSDLHLKIHTTMPAVQIYTGNWLAGQPNLLGGEYGDYAGVAIEPEFLPDTPNHPEWWEIGGISRAGETYCHSISYTFIPQ